jgi:ATP-dependent helicase YprA (DUF1998 family)/very-short-patch-repair endonuclease
MDIFAFRNQLVNDYSKYVGSFIKIKDNHTKDAVDKSFAEGAFWPEPLIQLNPAFEPGEWIDDLVEKGVLNSECKQIFRIKPELYGANRPLRLHRHQTEAIHTAQSGSNYVLTTGTGSGKSLTYIIPIVDRILKNGPGQGIQAIIVYPMNALANSQAEELKKFLCHGYPDGKGPVRFARYTGQENDEQRNEIIANPPDIILTNYVMLELILTRVYENKLINAAKGLKYLVLDELHTYRGRQGADVALLVRRVRDRLDANNMQCIGTSATMAGGGTYEERQKEVARVASLIFGADVKADHVIGETLRRVTPEQSDDDKAFINALSRRILDIGSSAQKYIDFINDPLSSWIESTFGLATEPESGRLIRAIPTSILGENGAAAKLANTTGLEVDLCARAIQNQLLAGYNCEPNPDTGFPPFAFRLHQFISKADTVYATLEPEKDRYITTQGQQFKPGDRSKILLPQLYCRECGQDYYCVNKTVDKETGKVKYETRELYNYVTDDNSFEPGFLYINTIEPWPNDVGGQIERLPDDWLDQANGTIQIKKDRRKFLPMPVRINSAGYEVGKDEDGIDAHYIKAQFRLCLNCGVSYGGQRSSDFSKLASLSSEGRSTATTILSLSAIRALKNDSNTLQNEKAKKLLSFTDNRQDASLQAGHFNDFIEVGLLRASLFRAIKNAGIDGLRHDELPQKVFDAIDLPFEVYAANPAARFQAADEAKLALKNVLSYRLYRDLKRGWRINLPNLEQCGLLEIKYLSHEAACEAEDLWQDRHPAIALASIKTRQDITKTLLDFMRRELVIKVDYLDSYFQERIKQQSSQRLVSPWAIDEDEKMEFARVIYPRARRNSDPGGKGDFGGNIYLSPRGGYGKYLKRTGTLNYIGQLKTEDIEDIIKQLLEILTIAGIVEQVKEPNSEEAVPGYQLSAASMLWIAGSGERAFHDPIRVPNQPNLPTNRFFVDYYKNKALDTKGFHSHEHTAQVPNEVRQERETDFRDGKLPIMFCSPTMELGVDISELNIVNMRNIPPTPANYAQRSGRAGRSGQPALVFSYCSTGSSHDQYFFRRQERMVAGSVMPPRIDLANEDLVKAHIHAIWLSETGLNLGKSLTEILDVNGDKPSLVLQESTLNAIENENAKTRAKTRAKNVLNSIQNELQNSVWFSDEWLENILSQIGRNFDNACNRWRDLYQSARKQAEAQDSVIRDASRSQEHKRYAERLRREAEAQMKLLTEVQNLVQSDFYSYRYFASEGFLPGYNFPRLPLSAFIPARKARQTDEFLSRPRFLAISEFGPRAFVYHEGSRYIINKAILPVGDDVLTGEAKVCKVCGYLHPIGDGIGPDLCNHCNNLLDLPMSPLFRLQNVSTARRDKINADEEERTRMGYEIITSVRFNEHGSTPMLQIADAKVADKALARLTYGQAATLWRINLGWTRRKNKNQLGFVLDTERGYWAKNDLAAQVDDETYDPEAIKVKRVIPFVEDHRNCLLFEPFDEIDETVMATLQAALKSAIQVQYQLEGSELAVEPLPSRDDRRIILIYESAEGGAGVLKRLVDEPDALSKVARAALELCHYNPETGHDERRAPHSKEDCEAACYDCFMNYGNQRDHLLLDRSLIKNILLELTNAKVETSPTNLSRKEHLKHLMNLTDSNLEKKWLTFMDSNNYRLPSKAQKLIESCNTRPDFFYDEYQAAIYIDGPHHDDPITSAEDIQITENLENSGITVIRFGYVPGKWPDIIDKFPYIFGKLASVTE